MVYYGYCEPLKLEILTIGHHKFVPNFLIYKEILRANYNETWEL